MFKYINYTLFFVYILLVITGPAKALDANNLTEREEYIVGNALHVTLHEMGHLLIDQLKIAVLGQEEDAADNFATIALIDKDTAFADNALANTAHFWFVMAEDQDNAAGAFFDEHDLDIQRAYRIVCHLVGVDPKAFDYLAEAAELSQDNYDSCGDSFEQTADSWFATLDSFKPQTEFENQFILEFETPKPEYKEALTIIQNGLFIEDAIDFINHNVKLPKPVKVIAASCGEPNAFYDSADVSVTICYELIDLYGAIYDATE
tara:strand:- start:19 stop:804 length:786 start_codon:yes stop_codon:yes gene_type:complete